MLRNSSAPPDAIAVTVIGAGIAGAWQALTFARAGHPVTLFERDESTMLGGTSRWAGGWAGASAWTSVCGRLREARLFLSFIECPFFETRVILKMYHNEHDM